MWRDTERDQEIEREILYSIDSESSKGYFRTLANKLLQDGKNHDVCVCVCVCVCVLVAKLSLSMGFSMKEYWSG